MEPLLWQPLLWQHKAADSLPTPAQTSELASGSHDCAMVLLGLANHSLIVKMGALK